jgi:hypothetical protein
MTIAMTIFMILFSIGFTLSIFMVIIKSKTIENHTEEDNQYEEYEKEESSKQPIIKNYLNNNTGLSKIMKDDTEHDFLARQLREERIKQIEISDMLDLKLSHYDNCESEIVTIKDN